ncbi:DUF2160 domain-containing protein [Oceanicella actignis]|uniref:Predicted small integral membrane protein n=1 Tax=Oceanicella actignis TaxID=1189325 RepID=A0A1M7SER9_9RHOB|nr:DUF2160 domain-containing protein [Oceanicella actignis]TYO91326.1 putative small integral membrane protein [Oceanicella actignis]SET23146.1 Predicted small integral membrane protein [Oceanicella actignis]SHN56989.1 Predicted small integral membrane protein [Oceanicella actignis]
MTTRKKAFLTTAAGVVLVLGALAAGLLAAAPRKDGAVDWTAPLIPNGWMAWTLATAAFFYVILCLLAAMTLWTAFWPQPPRMGVLRFETTPGDRLFVSLLGSAWICLGWLAFFGAPLTGALAVCLVWAAAVFRWV